ncbi:MAG: hypothetical protein AAFU70_04855 [Planctomycetota bacterium]
MTKPRALAAICGLALSPVALAQVINPADIDVPPGATLTITEDTEFTGTVTIGPGARILMGNGVDILVREPGRFIVNGTADEPVLFTTASTASSTDGWSGIETIQGAVLDVDHAVFERFSRDAVRVSGFGDATIRNSTFRDPAGFLPATGTLRSVFVLDGDVVIDGCTIGPIRGRDGSTGSSSGSRGGDGQDLRVVELIGGLSFELTNSRIFGVQAGRAGNGRQGSTGFTGGSGSTGTITSPTGGTGRTGGTGGRGGDGGTGGT